jgi:hypothetical protein
LENFLVWVKFVIFVHARHSRKRLSRKRPRAAMWRIQRQENTNVATFGGSNPSYGTEHTF